MAAKKENKMTGYLVISIIPIIGIIWAGIDGSIHSSHVKSAIQAEEAFEKHFVEKLNTTEFKDSDGNVIEVPEIESANIVSIVLKPHEAKLSADPYPETILSKGSYTVQIGADLLVPSSEQALSEKSYKLVYEFFVSQEIYRSFTENFDNGNIGIYGEANYTFETYFDYNPKNAPIYKLAQYFDQCYADVLLFTYDNETVINNGGAASVIDLIETIGEVELSDKDLLNKILAAYNRLSPEDKEGVSNYDVYLSAVARYAVLNVENMIRNVPELDEFFGKEVSPFQGIKNTYDPIFKEISKLTEEQLESLQAESIAKYKELENARYALEVSYQLAKVNLEQPSAKSQIKKCVGLYNELTVEQKAMLDTLASEDYDTLAGYVVIYNEGKNENEKITLEGKDE